MTGVPAPPSVSWMRSPVVDGLPKVLLGRRDWRSVGFEVLLTSPLKQLGDERHVASIVWHSGSSEQLAALGREGRADRRRTRRHRARSKVSSMPNAAGLGREPGGVKLCRQSLAAAVRALRRSARSTATNAAPS